MEFEEEDGEDADENDNGKVMKWMRNVTEENGYVDPAAMVERIGQYFDNNDVLYYIFIKDDDDDVGIDVDDDEDPPHNTPTCRK